MEDLLRHILEPIATEPEKIRVECEDGGICFARKSLFRS